MDPPFFYITLEQMAHAVTVLTNGSKAKGGCKLLISFMLKDEPRVKQAFKAFNLERTNLELEYATVQPNRWSNYCLWANTDLPMIKRVKPKK